MLIVQVTVPKKVEYDHVREYSSLVGEGGGGGGKEAEVISGGSTPYMYFLISCRIEQSTMSTIVAYTLPFTEQLESAMTQ